MQKLYSSGKSPISFNGRSYKLKNNCIIDNDSGKLFYEQAIDESKADWFFPHWGPMINVGDKYLLLYTEYEHSRGASSHYQNVDCLDVNGTLLFNLPNHVTEQVIHAGPDSNPNLECLLFLHFINGVYAYSNHSNSGAPCLELITVDLPRGGVTNRRVLELPTSLKAKYTQDNVSFIEAKLEKKKNGGVFMICAPHNRGGFGEDLTYRDELEFL